MQTKYHKTNKLGQVSDPSVPVCWDMGSDTCPKYEHIVHPFLPLYDENSTILILGSLPSVKSREQMVLLWITAEQILEGDAGAYRGRCSNGD